MSTLSPPIAAEDHAQGSPNAECTLVEYGDYQCSYCGQAYPVVKRLQERFGESLRFVFRNFPLAEAHPDAEHAAEAAEFAAAGGKFWEMHDLLYENQADLGEDALLALAGRLHLSADELDAALKAGTYRSHVRADFSGGVSSGVNGTPTFFIDGQRHDGSYDYKTLAGAVQRRVDAKR